MKIATKLTLLGAGALFLTACDNLDPDSTKNQFWYSNPTAQALTLKIDGQDYTLEPGKAAMLKLSPGMHKMQNSKGHQQDFMVYENNSGGIINPDNHIYYMLAEVYAVEGKSDRFKPALYENTINGYTFELPLRSANAVVIDHNLFNCSYPVGEAFPDQITTSNRQTPGNIKTKCFDKPELLAYIASEYGQKLDPQPHDDPHTDSVNRTFDYTIPQPAFKDPETRKQAAKLTSLLKQIQSSDDTNIHDKLNKEIHQAMLDVVGAAVKVSARNSVADNESYNTFINQAGEFSAYGVMPK